MTTGKDAFGQRIAANFDLVIEQLSAGIN